MSYISGGGGGGSGVSFSIPLIVGSGGTGQTSLTNRGIIIGSGASAVQSLVALNSGELLVGSASILAPQILGAGSQGTYLVANSSLLLGMSWIATGATGVAGSGSVIAGSAMNLAYYPVSGTAVDDCLISVNTGSGVAPFNVSILTSPAASSLSGDFYFISSNSRLFLRANSSGTVYSVELGGIG